jgi:uncharacterized alkaline shock family protein YloU
VTTSQPDPDAEGKNAVDNDPDTQEHLACGADVDELFEQVADGDGDELTAHQRDCVHCQAALTEFAALWAPVAEAAAAPVPIPEGLTAALTAGVMASVRLLVKDVWYTLQISDLGSLRVAARVVAAAARDAARQIPGVKVALGRSTQSRMAALVEKATRGHLHPHAAIGVLGRTAVVELSLAVTYGDSIDQVARAVQRHVIATLRDNIGLSSVTVNVTVDDILTDD